MRSKKSVLFVRPDYHCSFLYRDELRKSGWKADVYVPPNYPEKLLYSEKNIYAAMGKELIAMQNFNDGEIEESIKLFKESVELHPGNKKYYDGLVKAYYYSNQFEEVVDLYSYYLSNFVQVNAEVLYLFSVSLVNTGDNRGCDNIRIMSTNTNYQIDQKLLIACGYTL